MRGGVWKLKRSKRRKGKRKEVASEVCEWMGWDARSVEEGSALGWDGRNDGEQLDRCKILTMLTMLMMMMIGTTDRSSRTRAAQPSSLVSALPPLLRRRRRAASPSAA
jgi:hypothetical protein